MSLNLRSVLSVLFFVLGLLLIPLIAGQFSNAVNWSLMDFIVAGTLLFGAGLVWAYFWGRTKKRSIAIAIVVGSTLLVVLLWIELAVGIFGTPFAGS